MDNTKQFYIIYQDKVTKKEVKRQIINLNNLQNEFSFTFQDELVTSDYSSGTKKISEEIEFFNISLPKKGMSFDFSLTYYAPEIDYFAINQLTSDNYELFVEYENQLLNMLVANLPNCVLVGHDNHTEYDISYVYQEFKNGENLDNLFISYIKI